MFDFDLTCHIARQPQHRAVEFIKEACRLIAGCPDPDRRAAAMPQLRRLQAFVR